jgi:hypothetical protein
LRRQRSASACPSGVSSYEVELSTAADVPDVSDDDPPPQAASSEAKAIATASGTRLVVEETGPNMDVVVWFCMGAQDAVAGHCGYCRMQPIRVSCHCLRHFGL